MRPRRARATDPHVIPVWDHAEEWMVEALTHKVLDRLAALQPTIAPRVQIVLAASMWLIGASILLFRGAGYIDGQHWHAWALGIGLALGAFKSRMLLDRIARKAIARIHHRGTAGFLGFFSLRSWALIAAMMGGGITLRHVVSHPGATGEGIMGAIYVGVGTALLLSDRVFWHAAFAETPMTEVV